MSFAEPLAFLFAGLYGVLVVLYLWERWRRRVEVPSLLLWEVVREDTIRARRFRPDLLFILQLLLLSCLIVGLARPYLSGGPGTRTSTRHIFVLDTSASMQAREARQSRFEQARAQALDLLARPAARRGGDAHHHGARAGSAGQFHPRPRRRGHGTAAASRRPTPAAISRSRSPSPRARGSAATRRRRWTCSPTFHADSCRSRPAITPECFRSVRPTTTSASRRCRSFRGRFQDFRRARAYVLVENFAHREGHGFLTVRLGRIRW